MRGDGASRLIKVKKQIHRFLGPAPVGTGGAEGPWMGRGAVGGATEDSTQAVVAKNLQRVRSTDERHRTGWTTPFRSLVLRYLAKDRSEAAR